MCLLLSMVVWQPFGNCWLLIIARVAEMHVAYHTGEFLVVYLHQRNKQGTTLYQYFPYLDLVCDMSCLSHYISSISPCFLYLVTNYVQ
jgi:hypothetical protein